MIFALCGWGVGFIFIQKYFVLNYFMFKCILFDPDEMIIEQWFAFVTSYDGFNKL